MCIVRNVFPFFFYTHSTFSTIKSTQSSCFLKQLRFQRRVFWYYRFCPTLTHPKNHLRRPEILLAYFFLSLFICKYYTYLNKCTEAYFYLTEHIGRVIWTLHIFYLIHDGWGDLLYFILRLANRLNMHSITRFLTQPCPTWVPNTILQYLSKEFSHSYCWTAVLPINNVNFENIIFLYRNLLSTR